METEPQLFESRGEVFRLASDFGHWLGFYDWLRRRDGAIVGVRLQPDSPEVLHLFNPYLGPAVLIEAGSILMRTSTEDCVEAALSDDADFGGNAVFVGSTGSLAVSFFCPAEDVVFATEPLHIG